MKRRKAKGKVCTQCDGSGLLKVPVIDWGMVYAVYECPEPVHRKPAKRGRRKGGG